MVREAFKLAVGVGMDKFCHRNLVATKMTATFKISARTVHNAILIYVNITNSVKERDWNILEFLKVVNIHVSGIAIGCVLKSPVNDVSSKRRVFLGTHFLLGIEVSFKSSSANPTDTLVFGSDVLLNKQTFAIGQAVEGRWPF